MATLPETLRARFRSEAERFDEGEAVLPVLAELADGDPALLASVVDELRPAPSRPEDVRAQKTVSVSLPLVAGPRAALATMDLAAAFLERSASAKHPHQGTDWQLSGMMLAMLASTHPAEELLAVIDELRRTDRHFDVCVALAQELVLRGLAVGSPVLERLSMEMRRRRDRFAELPMRRFSFESRLVPREKPRYAWGLDLWTPECDESELVLRGRPLPLTEQATDARFVAWHPNRGFADRSSSEARAFMLREDAPADLGRLIAALGLECCAGLDRCAWAEMSAPAVYKLVFEMASRRGSRVFGTGGAQCRLEAAEAIAALCGLASLGPHAALEGAADATRWIYLRGNGGSFWRPAYVLYAVALLAIGPDRRSVRFAAVRTALHDTD